MSADQDTEITLTAGKLLGVFFGMVAISAVFFSLGYTVGKGSTRSLGTVYDDSVTATPTVSGVSKPAAGKPEQVAAPETKNCADGDADCAPVTKDEGGLTADNAGNSSLENQKTGDAQPASGIFRKSEPDTKPASTNVEPAATKTIAPVSAVASKPSSGFLVQVAAVSKQEDADALVSALRRKQYPVFVVNNLTNSNLFHVEVGPFQLREDAEQMRSRLAKDGYNAILK